MSDDDVVLARMARRWLLSRDRFGDWPTMWRDKDGAFFVGTDQGPCLSAVNEREREVIYRIWKAGMLAEAITR